jgi:hypothetical protein
MILFLQFLFPCGPPRQRRLLQVQSSGQRDRVESTVLAAEDRAENSEVPKFRGKESEREGAGLACDADQNESTLMPKMMGFELSLKKIAPAKLQECSGMVPTTFTNIIEQSSKKWRAGISLAGNEGRSPHIRHRVSSAFAVTKFEALSN